MQNMNDLKNLNVKPAKLKKTISKNKIKENFLGLSMAIGPVIGFLIFGFIPILMSIILSFTQLFSYNIFDAKFVGINNYTSLLKTPEFYKAIGNTLYFCLNIFFAIAIALFIAVLLNKIVKFKKIFASIFFIPYICSIVAVSNMWKWMFETNYGIINGFLKALGFQPVAWLQDPKFFMPSIIIMSVWSGIGFNIILYQAALSTINKTYYEAADIDGANAVSKFFNITLPAISPTTFYLLIMGLIGSLQVFTPMQIMTEGQNVGPDGSGLTIVYYLYNMAFKYRVSQGVGLASALACMLAVLIVIITVINFRLSDKWVSYGD